MKTLMKILIVLTICIVVVGFYRGWFSLSSGGRDAEANRVNVSLTVDPGRMKDDAEMVKEKATELTDKAAAEAEKPGDSAEDSVKPDDE